MFWFQSIAFSEITVNKPSIVVNTPSIVANTPSIVVNTPSTKPKEKRSTNGIKLSGTADDTDYESKIMKWDTSPDPVNPSKKARK